jgi:hypothetical protein
LNRRGGKLNDLNEAPVLSAAKRGRRKALEHLKRFEQHFLLEGLTPKKKASFAFTLKAT